MAELIFKVADDGAMIQIEEDGVSRWKRLNTFDLINCLLESVQKARIVDMRETPMLPVGTIKYAEESEGTYTLYLYQGPFSADKNFNDRIFNNIGIPGAIYKIGVRNQMTQSICVWPVKSTDKIAPNISLYEYPFYHGTSGNLCLGGNRLKVKNPIDLFRVPFWLASLPELGHAAPQIKTKLRGDSYYKKLVDKPYPDSWLKPAGKKLNDIL